MGDGDWGSDNDDKNSRHGTTANNRLRLDGSGRRFRLWGIAARQGQRLIADGQSKDDNPQGGDGRTTERVDTLNCSNGRGVASVMTTTMMHK